MKFLAQLQNPPREFTAIPFWFLNGELTAEELRRQLADFAAHGIYGVVLHPRMGLSPDITYLGERYFAHIRTAVEAAAALDMKIVLYDEGMYPSGSASGLVVKDHPELASEGITLTQTVLPGDELLAQAERRRAETASTPRSAPFGTRDFVIEIQPSWSRDIVKRAFGSCC